MERLSGGRNALAKASREALHILTAVSERRLALAPARQPEVAPARVGCCVELIFSHRSLRRALTERSPEGEVE